MEQQVPRTILRILAVAAVALAITSCRGKAAREFQTAYDPKVVAAGLVSVEDRAALRARLDANAETLETLWVRLGVTVRQDGKRAAPGFTTVAMYRQPDQIMLGISRAELGTLYTIQIRGEEAAFYSNRDKRLYVGTLDELAAKSALIGGLRPPDLVAAVQIQDELRRVLNSPEPVVVVDQGEHLLVAARHPASRRQMLWLVRKADALVQELLVRSPRGAEELRIRYGAYQLVRNGKTGRELPYPSRVVFEFPSEQVTVEAEAREYRLDTNLPTFAALKARETYPLSALQFEEDP